MQFKEDYLSSCYAVYSLDQNTRTPRVRKDQENVTIDIKLSRYGSLSKDSLVKPKDKANF